eukprot:scaffold5160_cov107-Isochrysis_galbana.AAC.7
MSPDSCLTNVDLPTLAVPTTNTSRPPRLRSTASARSATPAPVSALTAYASAQLTPRSRARRR